MTLLNSMMRFTNILEILIKEFVVIKLNRRRNALKYYRKSKSALKGETNDIK